MVKEIPAFMADDARAHVAESMRQNPELWAAAARFASVGVDVGDRLATIMRALELKEIKTVAEWRSTMGLYDGQALQRKGRDRSSNPDMPSNAFYLCQAITRLLELAGAPVELSNDLRWLLHAKLPTSAEKRARVQALLISNPEMSRKKIAREAKCSLKLIQKDIDSGLLVQFPEGVDS